MKIIIRYLIIEDFEKKAMLIVKLIIHVEKIMVEKGRKK